VAKGAAVVADDQPQRFRAVRPADLFAGIVQRQTRQLDELEGQLAQDPETTADRFVRLAGERAFLDLAGRAIAREPAELNCLGTPRMLGALAPSFRKRALDGTKTRVWALGSGALPPTSLEGTVPLERAQLLLGAPVGILIAGSSVMFARLLERETTGYWASDPDVVAATRGALAALTGGNV
jgi:hypothetical protein